jgi:O-antigen ligase
MEEIILKEDTLTNKISYYHIMLLLASLPFDMFYSHIIVASFALHTFIHLSAKNIKPIFTAKNALLQSVFWVTVLSTIYTTNRAGAFNEWGKQIMILLLPLLLCLNPLNLKKYRSRLLIAFSLVCTLVILCLYIGAFRTIKFYHLPYSDIFSPAFTNHNFAEPINIHATFFSLQIAIALICMLTALIKERSNLYRVIYALCTCVLLAGIIQLSAKSVFVALFLIINIAIPVFILKGKRRFRFTAIASVFSVMIVTVILSVSNLREHFINDLNYDLSFTSSDKLLDSRLDRWKTSLELIEKAPIIGHGAGTELALLHDHFFEKKYYSSFINNLNTHSEYLSFLLKSGLIGFLIYLITLIYGFKQAIKHHDLLFFAFMLLIAFVSLSENLLDVDKGIIFYAIFFSFFMYSANSKTYEVLKTP